MKMTVVVGSSVYVGFVYQKHASGNTPEELWTVNLNQMNIE